MIVAGDRGPSPANGDPSRTRPSDGYNPDESDRTCVTRIASLVLLGGALIVLLGTGVGDTARRRRSRRSDMETGRFPSSWVTTVLALAAISIETVSTAPRRFTVATVETTPIAYVAVHWFVVGVAAAALLALYAFDEDRRHLSALMSTGLAILALFLAFYEVFILVPSF